MPGAAKEAEGEAAGGRRKRRAGAPKQAEDPAETRDGQEGVPRARTQPEKIRSVRTILAMVCDRIGTCSSSRTPRSWWRRLS